MNTYGSLTIQLFIHNQPTDAHGRMSGSWRTLFNRMMERKDVDNAVKGFMELNPWLQPGNAELNIHFTIREHIY